MTEDQNGKPDEAAEDADYIERIATPMRHAEQLDVTFEARVMSAIHAEARAGHAPQARSRFDWWLRARELRLSPLAGLAAAAAFAALTVLSSLSIHRFAGNQPVPAAAVPADTVHLVRFVFIDSTARSVSLVGDFNEWEKGATRLDVGPGGTWLVTLPLQAGRHEYAFIVEGANGERWVADPFGATVRDEFDTESSVIMLGGGTNRPAARSST